MTVEIIDTVPPRFPDQQVLLLEEKVAELEEGFIFLTQAHVIASSREEARLLAQRFIKIEENQEPICDACVLKYDITDSESLFEGLYHLSNQIFHSAVARIAYQYGFRWTSGKDGDGAHICAAPNLDESFQLTPEQTLINACHCALDLQQLLKDPQGVKDRLFGSDYSVKEFDDLTEIVEALPPEKRNQLILKVRIAQLGSITFWNNLANVRAFEEEDTKSLIKLDRIANFLPGPFLIRHLETEKLLIGMDLDPDDQLVCLDEGVYLQRDDNIPGPKYKIVGWQLEKVPPL